MESEWDLRLLDWSKRPRQTEQVLAGAARIVAVPLIIGAVSMVVASVAVEERLAAICVLLGWAALLASAVLFLIAFRRWRGAVRLASCGKADVRHLHPFGKHEAWGLTAAMGKSTVEQTAAAGALFHKNLAVICGCSFAAVLLLSVSFAIFGLFRVRTAAPATQVPTVAGAGGQGTQLAVPTNPVAAAGALGGWRDWLEYRFRAEQDEDKVVLTNHVSGGAYYGFWFSWDDINLKVTAAAVPQSGSSTTALLCVQGDVSKTSGDVSADITVAEAADAVGLAASVTMAANLKSKGGPKLELGESPAKVTMEWPSGDRAVRRSLGLFVWDGVGT